MNPFTLKELRQLTRSKVISGMLVGFLLSALLLSYFIPVGGVTYDTGRTLFSVILLALGVLTLFILPANVFVRMMKERGGKRAADLTLATALPASAVIDGKIRSVLALIGLSLTAALPFSSFAYLLHGISLERMAESLLSVALLASVLVHFAILVASLRLSAGFRWVAYIAFVVIGVLVCLPAGSAAFSWHPAGESQSFQGGFFVFAAVGVSLCLFVRAFAIAVLTPRSREHDLVLRVTTLVLVAGWGVYAYLRSSDAIQVWTVFAFLVFTVLSIFALVQPVGYSRRQIAAFRTKPIWRRIVFWPFMSGAANGFAFAFAGAVAVSLARPLLGNGQDTKWIAFTILLYNSALLLVLRAFWRVAAKRWANLSPILVLGLFLLVLGFLQSLPDLLGVEAAAVPFCYHGLKDDVIFDHHLLWAFAAFAVALVLNVPALIRRR